MGGSGAQIHLAEIKMVDEALRGSFLNNVQFSVQANNLPPAAVVTDLRNGWASLPAYTFYLSYRASSWDDDSVIAVHSTGAGGGNGNLTCKRIIKTNETGSTVAEQIGPVHVWAECTDIGSATTPHARVTLTAWGKMILLVEDF